ncbi:hypothetical protein BFJ70_g14482 [Fusarium oxysporum]|nr:hypothetical protein NW765_010945 [Fusarium oxysporum]KAJ4279318.1 hypothetical protein NW764_006681 [Fusarium oxysporum]RKL18157.1 hypothetical protein BFJ70_g14482 [Fusarium oxysporum]
MKASVIYGLAALFGASRVIADCVEGHCETITPDYIVEHKCNMYRTGTTHEKVASAKDCAALCQAAGVGVCPYHPPPKKCIVSKPDGEDRTRADVMYITKVEIDDPFVEPDLFAETDAEAKEACLAREAALESELCSVRYLGKERSGPLLSAPEDRFGRLQGRMRCCRRRYDMPLLRPRWRKPWNLPSVLQAH